VRRQKSRKQSRRRQKVAEGVHWGLGMVSRWFALLAIAFVACGRNPMGIPGRDGASVVHPRDSMMAAPDTDAGTLPAPDQTTASAPDGARDLAPVPTDGPGPQATADACVPLVCRDPTCYPAYCGEIGDGCGAMLDCGGCAAGSSCKGGQCFPEDCRPLTCDGATPSPYCGSIGDSCGGSLDCACPNPTWPCLGHFCMPEGCVPISGCANAWGEEYCGGLIGDGCAGVLDCRRDCSRPGFACQSNICVDGSGRSRPYDSGALDPLPPPPPVWPPPPPPPCPPPPPPPAPHP
jgi:hypothetical protein